MKAPWLVLVCAVAHAAPPQQIATDTSHEGRLITRERGEVVDIPLQHTDVAIRVDGFLADATVTQRFKNPYRTKIEAVYLFPLPTHAAVTDMTIAIGDRKIRGTIEERDKATRIYEAARDRGLVAALLTEERPNLFTQSIANLEPGATIDVTLHYVERLAYADGGYELVFPMVAGPRYLPGGTPKGARREEPSAPARAIDATIQPAVLPEGVRSSHDISLAVDVDAGVPIERLTSPSHVVTVDRRAPARAHVAIAAGDTIPNKDFVLRYRVAGAAPEFGVLAHRDGGTGSFLLLAQPPALTAKIPVAPREIVFVLDTSSSMRGAPLAKAKAVIADVLHTLRPDDTFQIVRFDDRASALGAAPIANKPRNIELTLDWLGKLDAGGGTEMVTGIAAALAVPHDPARLRIVAFLTDGYVGNEDQILAAVGRELGEARLFCFGVGSAVNRYLLEEMAAIGRGAAQFVRPDEDTREVVAAFDKRIATPVLTDLRIDWGGLAVTDLAPRALPDLFDGQPLALAGRYTQAGTATVTIRGKLGGRDTSFAIPVTLPEADATRPAIATVWARQRIAELDRKLIRKADADVEKQIVALSLEHHMLTRYTAFVAVDDSRVTTGGPAKRVAVPVDVPDSVRNIELARSSGMLGSGYGGGGVGYGALGIGSYSTIGHGSGSGSGYGASYGGGMRGHTAAVPILVLAQPVVVGDLDKAIIRRYVKRSLEKLRYCYEKALLAAPTLDGTLATRFTIDGSGNVVASEASGLDPAVDSCVADVIKTIKFPSAVGGGTVQVNYPLTFHPHEIVEKNR